MLQGHQHSAGKMAGQHSLWEKQTSKASWICWLSCTEGLLIPHWGQQEPKFWPTFPLGKGALLATLCMKEWGPTR